MELDAVPFLFYQNWRVAFTENVVIRFLIEKDAEDSDNKIKTSVMKGPSIVEELNKKLKVGQDILKVTEDIFERTYL